VLGADLLGRWRARLALAAGIAVLGGCGPLRDGAATGDEARRCHYDVTVVSPDSAELWVSARCDGRQVRRFVASEGEMAHQVSMQTPDGTPVPREGASFELPEGAAAVVDYQLSLHEVARESGHIDVALESGGAWIAAVSTWILAPEPIADDALATLAIHTPDEDDFASGLARSGDGYALPAREIRFATYGVFGEIERQTIELPGPLSLDGGDPGRRAQIELVTLPGRLEASPALLRRWLRESAEAVSTFWGGFPVERACVVLIPTADYDRVAHGKVVAAGGATVVIHVGADADEAALYDDWILVHELFHLGFPSMISEGKWLDEGLATYYEPIIRARAGWRTPELVWAELSGDMPRGLAAVEQQGVDQTRSYEGVYWGGAILSLLADVEARRRSEGRVGLEDGLRAILAAGGDASAMWPLERAVAVIDERLGAPTLAPLVERHSRHGSPVDLPGVMRALGVARQRGGVRLHDEAPLAAVRRAIVEGARGGDAPRRIKH
jgi:hypothetical protein